MLTFMMFLEFSVIWLNTEVYGIAVFYCHLLKKKLGGLDDSVLLLLTSNVTGPLGLRSRKCSGRAVQASLSYEPRVPPPFLSSRTLPASNWPVPRDRIKDNACPVSVPCAEKCWSTPPSPLSLHAEKCVTLP